MSTAYFLRDYTDSASADYPMTGSYVASDSFVVAGLPNHSLFVVYDPDENDGVCNIEVQTSADPETTTDANSEWLTLGVATRSTAVVTYAADTVKLNAAAAGTKVYLQFTYADAPAQKIRVRVKETFTGAGTGFGNVRIYGYSYSN
jgi:hypothetical protein